MTRDEVNDRCICAWCEYDGPAEEFYTITPVTKLENGFPSITVCDVCISEAKNTAPLARARIMRVAHARARGRDSDSAEINNLLEPVGWEPEKPPDDSSTIKRKHRKPHKALNTPPI